MSRFSVTCPNCKALLDIDGESMVVTGHTPPVQPRTVTSFEDRLDSLVKEREQAKAKLAEAFRAEKAGAELREEKFRRLLESASQGEPEKPLKDIDLD